MKGGSTAGRRVGCSRLAGWLFSTLLMAIGPAAMAASDADRDKLMAAAKRGLEAVERELGRVASDPSDRNVETIIADSADIAEAVKDLDRIADGNRQAEAFVESYAENLGKMAGPLRTLGEMEDAQASIDKLPATCQAANARLEDQIEALVRVPEEEDEKAIETLTSQIETTISAALDKADRLGADIKHKRAAVARVAFSEAEWRDVGRALGRAGSEVQQHFDRSLTSAHRACDGLSQAGKLDYVAAALALVRASYDAAEKFLADGEAWFEDTRAVFRVNCDGLDDVRVAYCAVDHGPGEGGENRAKVNAWPLIIDRVNRVRGELNPLLTRYEALKKTGEYIKATTGSDEVTRLLTNMGKRYRGLLAIRDGALMQGSRNPWLQTWQNYGVTQHVDMTRRFACDEDDTPIPGSSKRPDCFVAKTCTIIEFKPDHPDAERLGDEQLVTYQALLQDYFEELLEEASEEKGWVVSGAYGGDDVLAKLIDAGCVDEDRETVTLEMALATYDRCDKLVPTCPEP